MLYCESIHDDVLVSNCRDKTFLIGCPGCANFSLFIRNGRPKDGMYSVTPTGLKAVSMIQELDRIKSLYESNGIFVEYWVPKYPNASMCMVDENTQKAIQKMCEGFDHIVIFACDCGIKNIKKIIGNKNIISGMKVTAIASAVPQKGISKMAVDKDSLDLLPITIG